MTVVKPDINHLVPVYWSTDGPDWTTLCGELNPESITCDWQETNCSKCLAALALKAQVNAVNIIMGYPMDWK